MMRWVLEVLRGKWYQCISVTMTNEQFTCIIALCDYMVWCVSQLPSYVRRTLKDSIFVPPQYLAQSLVNSQCLVKNKSCMEEKDAQPKRR